MKPSELEAAIRAGNLEKIRELIAAETDIIIAFADGTTPIQLAAREGQVTILRALAGAGADLDDLETLDFQERMKLFADSMLDQTSDDDDLITTDQLSAWAMQAVAERMDPAAAAEIAAMEGAMFRAVRIGDIELLQERIAAGDEIDQLRIVTNDTPLTLAVQKGDEEMVLALIQAGANVNHAGFSTPLSFALPNLRMAKILIAAGAESDVRGMDHTSPLERAVHRALSPASSDDSPLLVRFFLEAGVHPPSAESVDGTMLLETEHAEAWEIYQQLLPHYPDEVAAESFEEIGYRRDRQEDGGGVLYWTFDLQHAASEGDVEELREVLKRRPDDIKERSGPALVKSIANLQLETAGILIDAGTDLDAVIYEQRRGSSPLASAAESWHRRSVDAMRLLVDAGAAVDQRGGCGRTPLMYAVLLAYRHGAPLRKSIPWLLDNGADPNLEDQFGLTAWALARAPVIEDEERSGLGEALPPVFFDGPDLSELFSERANRADRRRDRLDRCREALDLLAAAGAVAQGEEELRLLMAATAGRADRVAELLAAGAGADARGIDGHPAIAAAAENGSREIVELLIAAGCKVDAQSVGRPSALEAAVRGVDPVMTRQLIDAGANVYMLLSMSRAAVQAAEAAGGGAIVRMLRDALPPELANIDRDIESEIESEDLTYNSQRELPRHAAMGDLGKVRELLAVKAVEVDGFDALRRTPLSAAAEAGHHQIVEQLIAAGADVNRCNEVAGSPRSTPLTCAAIGSSAQRDRILRLLLDAGADPDRVGADGRTALMQAVESDVGFFGRTGSFALSTRTLIEAGADLEIGDPFGLTAWMRAISLAWSIEIDEVVEHYEAVAGLLAEAGASTAGRPAIELIWAVVGEEAEIVSELLAAGAPVNARRHDGSTALMLAVRDGRQDAARLLIEAGADVEARQWLDRGPTAMDAAAEAESRGLVRMLVEAGATPAEE